METFTVFATFKLHGVVRAKKIRIRTDTYGRAFDYVERALQVAGAKVCGIWLVD